MAIEAGLLQVVRHDFRAGGEAGLHPRFARQPLLDGLLRDEAGADHDARVRRVRAARDRRDHDRAVLDLLRDGRQHRDAALVRHPHDARIHRRRGLPGDHHARKRRRKPLLRALEGHAILRALRPGEARLDRVEIDVDRFGVDGIRRGLLHKKALGLRVRLDQGDPIRVA